MLDNSDFEEMLKEHAKYDSDREIVIKDSRDVIKLSKQVINAVMREESAESLVKEMKDKLKSINKTISKNIELQYEGSYKAAVMEYVEAIVFYGIITKDKIFSKKDLDVSSDHYLLGISDVTGELMRKAIIEATKENYKLVEKIRNVIDEIYVAMSKFDFRDSEMRRKYDSIKYDLKRIEDLNLELKLKNKI